MNRRHAILAGVVLFTIWLWVAFDRPYTFPTHIPWNPYSNRPQSDPTKDVFDFAPLDSQPLRDLCSMTEWNSSLIFTCDNNHGGVGHVRNSILNCVRYAISAGASLVMPNIALREVHGDGIMEPHEHLDRRHGPGRKGMEYMFDKQHFKASLEMSCPELKLINHMEQTSSERRRALSPESLFNNHPISGLEHPEEFPPRLETWISQHISSTPQKEPVVIDLEQSLLQYPTHADGHGVAHSFGNILKFRSDVRALATTTLLKLSHWYDLSLNISEPIIIPSFFGAHLRTESEHQFEERHVTEEVYSNYASQATAYLEQASTSSTRIMYVTSGNISEVTRLATQATEYGIDVTSKHDLLKGRDRDMLESLKWDQRALVDYLVLLKAQEFAGVGHSTFSWNVALKRHEYTEEKAALQGNEKWKLWSDKQSTLYGVLDGYADNSKCMWP